MKIPMRKCIVWLLKMLLPSGFRNDGNVCFASAALHLLLNQEVLKKLLDDVRFYISFNEMQELSGRLVSIQHRHSVL